jgi:hypothetical protein
MNNTGITLWKSLTPKEQALNTTWSKGYEAGLADARSAFLRLDGTGAMYWIAARTTWSRDYWERNALEDRTIRRVRADQNYRGE